MEIKIVGVKKDLTTPAGGAKVDIYLQLSEAPPPGWAQHFEAAWQSRFYSMRRDARVEGPFILICCPPAEIAQCHQTYLDLAVADANRQYAEEIQRTQAAQQRKQAEEETKIKNANDVLSGLKWGGNR